MKTLRISYEEVFDLLHRACTTISPDALYLMKQAAQKETNACAKTFLETMIKNVGMAGTVDKPVCQSPGYPTCWIRYGDPIDISNLLEYLPKAVIEATNKGYMRPSIVHPLTRYNPGDSSGKGVPNIEIQHVDDLPYLEVILSAKGCGAELGNVMKVMTPASIGKNFEGLKELVLNAAINAGGKPCPPTAIGIGIGGQMDVAAKLSRQAISTRNWMDTNPEPMMAALEKELYEDINKLGIGPAGIGGDTSTLAVKIAWASTHTAICPVCVNFHCWVARRFGVRFYPDGKRETLFNVMEDAIC